MKRLGEDLAGLRNLGWPYKEAGWLREPLETRRPVLFSDILLYTHAVDQTDAYASIGLVDCVCVQQDVREKNWPAGLQRLSEPASFLIGPPQIPQTGQILAQSFHRASSCI
jgi:hypothetical protein